MPDRIDSQPTTLRASNIPLARAKGGVSNSPMPVESFQASRWTTGNLIFPTLIEVSEKSVTRKKRRWFGTDEISISMSKVASVHIKTGMVWSEIIIESSGGSDPLASQGHTKGDARRIKELIGQYQTRPTGESKGREES